MKLLILFLTPFICLSAERIKVVYLTTEKEDRLTIYRFDNTAKEVDAIMCKFTKSGGSYNKDSIKTVADAQSLLSFMSKYGWINKVKVETYKQNPFILIRENAYLHVETLLLLNGHAVTAYDESNGVYVVFFSNDQ